MATLWSCIVTLNSVDVTARLTGIVTIDAEESSERTAVLFLTANTGAVDLNGMRGQTLNIDFVNLDTSTTTRLFTGYVVEPVYDPLEKIIRLDCSDRLRDRLALMTRPQIDALLPGSKWSADVFDADADSYEYALDRLSTLPGALDADAAGIIAYTAWAAKPTADIALTAADGIDETPAVTVTPVTELINHSTVTFQYRYERLYQREASGGWSYDRTQCEHLFTAVALPTREMARRAAEGVSGWLLRSIGFTPVWPSSGVICNGQPIVWINNQPGLIIGYAASWARRWTQTLDESYTLDLSATGSIAAYGERLVTVTASLSTELDVDSWEGSGANNRGSSGVIAASGGDGDDADSGGGSVGGGSNYPPYPGAIQNSWGDWIFDVTEATRRQEAIEAVLAREQVKILESHRRNVVEFETPLSPAITLQTTVQLTLPTLTAKGKVRQLTHTLDNSGQGRHVMRVTLAISLGGTPPTPSALTAPVALFYDPTPPSVIGSVHASGNQFGGRLTSPPYNDELPGFASNYYVVAPGETVYSGSDPQTGELIQPGFVSAVAIEPGAPEYPTRFRINADAIEAAVRDAATVTGTASYVVAPPTDVLTLSA